jgi:hypothetical protein
MKTSYSATAGTAWITFENARVPVGNTLGQEGGGIFVILRWGSSLLHGTTSTKPSIRSNFNHERWVMCCSSARSQRLITEECLKFVSAHSHTSDVSVECSSTGGHPSVKCSANRLARKLLFERSWQG